MNMKTAIQLNSQFQERANLIMALNRVELECADLLVAYPAAETSGSDIQLEQRNLLKASNELNELTAKFDDALGLSFLSPAEAAAVNEVVDVRQLTVVDYHRAIKLENQLNRIARELAQHASSKVYAKLTEYRTEAKAIRKGLFDLYWALPDLGMTFAEWNEMTTIQRRQLRPAGRPALPLEARISDAKAAVARQLQVVHALSFGKISTLEEGLAGVKLSAQGRPAVSPMGKLDRQIGRQLKELQSLDAKNFQTEAEYRANPRGGDTYAMRANRIQGRINEMRAELREMEDELEGVAVHRRKLEKLRAEHRDLALLESNVKGEEQATILFSILKNEEQQHLVIEQIHLMDKNATEANTHKVNPAETRERIKRLEMNGRLAEAEQMVLMDLKRALNDTRTIRSR